MGVFWQLKRFTMGIGARARLTHITCFLLAVALSFTLSGCRGSNVSTAAPSEIPNTQDSTERRPEGPFDCVPSESGEGWDCEEVD